MLLDEEKSIVSVKAGADVVLFNFGGGGGGGRARRGFYLNSSVNINKKPPRISARLATTPKLNPLYVYVRVIY